MAAFASGARRVDDADQREQRQVIDQRQQVGSVGIEGGGVEVARGGRHDAQALLAEALVLGLEGGP